MLNEAEIVKHHKEEGRNLRENMCKKIEFKQGCLLSFYFYFLAENRCPVRYRLRKQVLFESLNRVRILASLYQQCESLALKPLCPPSHGGPLCLEACPALALDSVGTVPSRCAENTVLVVVRKATVTSSPRLRTGAPFFFFFFPCTGINAFRSETTVREKKKKKARNNFES